MYSTCPWYCAIFQIYPNMGVSKNWGGGGTGLQFFRPSSHGKSDDRPIGFGCAAFLDKTKRGNQGWLEICVAHICMFTFLATRPLMSRPFKLLNILWHFSRSWWWFQDGLWQLSEGACSLYLEAEGQPLWTLGSSPKLAWALLLSSLYLEPELPNWSFLSEETVEILATFKTTVASVKTDPTALGKDPTHIPQILCLKLHLSLTQKSAISHQKWTPPKLWLALAEACPPLDPWSTHQGMPGMHRISPWGASYQVAADAGKELLYWSKVKKPPQENTTRWDCFRVMATYGFVTCPITGYTGINGISMYKHVYEQMAKMFTHFSLLIYQLLGMQMPILLPGNLHLSQLQKKTISC